jgi:hypothetical protein
MVLKQPLGVQVTGNRTRKQSRGMMIGKYISLVLVGSSSAFTLH